jgi:hypothetical protein
LTRSNAHNSRDSRGLWFRLLLTAPGKVVTLESPHTPDEITRRLRAAPSVAKLLERGQATLKLPTQNNERRFFMWIEPGKTGGSRIVGQMQTPLRAATMRLLITLLLAGLGLFWMALARFWLGGLFLFFAVGFLLLSQYERVVGRDLRLHLRWLQQALDARLIEKS